MRRNIKRKLYKLMSDAGLSSLSAGTFGMISSMLTSNDPTLMFLSTGLLTGGLACRLSSEFLLIREEIRSIESEESIWNNSKLYYLELEKNKIKRVEMYILYKRGVFTSKQKESLFRDLYMDKILLNKKIEVLNENRYSIEEKITILSKIENCFNPSDLYLSLKEFLLEDAKVVNFSIDETNVNKVNNKKYAKIYEFPKNKDK